MEGKLGPAKHEEMRPALCLRSQQKHLEARSGGTSDRAVIGMPHAGRRSAVVQTGNALWMCMITLFAQAGRVYEPNLPPGSGKPFVEHTNIYLTPYKPHEADFSHKVEKRVAQYVCEHRFIMMR